VKKTINLDFCDFHPNFPKTDNFYYHLLRDRFEVRLCDQPDFLIFGPYGHEHRLHSGVRIFVSIEPGLPDFRFCDYSISCRTLEHPRHLHLPSYVTCSQPADFIKHDESPEHILAQKTRFCGFIVSNYHPRRNRHRVDFFHKLSRYKRVDSGGKAFNNIGGPLPDGSASKIDFLRSCKFNLSYENRARAGYTTEKICDAMAARALPIYWGDPLINEQFNPRSFLNRADFASDEALIEKIIELDCDDAQYLEYVRQPYFHDNQPSRFFDRTRLLDFFERIFSDPIEPVAQRQRRRWFSPGRWMTLKRHHRRSSPWPAPSVPPRSSL